MPKYTNISNGPRGGYLDGKLVMVEAGEGAELDDAPKEWFKRAGKADGASADEGKAPVEPATADEITAAVAKLDAENDDHWTAGGLPAVDVVAELAGKPVTRASITGAAADAKRPTPQT